MKKLLTLMLVLITISASAQENSVLNQLKTDPKKAYGGDCPYPVDTFRMTEAPSWYEPFYISHYGRHGSRYYWEKRLYLDLDTVMTLAHERRQLTPEGEAFYDRFMAIKDELMTGATELTQLGWDQHQGIARKMYNRFTKVFEKGGNVLAISSLSGRCVMSMSAFCQELVQCNPALEIREQSSRFTLDAVVPDDGENPIKHSYKRVTPRWEANKDKFVFTDSLPDKIIQRVFTSTDGLPGGASRIADDLLRLYTSLPNINHDGLMGNIVTDEEIVNRWEYSNLHTYSWVFNPQYNVVPILQDIIRKADDVIAGKSDHLADLRFGHDTYLGPLTILMGLNGTNRDPEDPYEVKNTYQNWQTCKAANIQLIFYRGQGAQDDILVKCLLNGAEVSMPVETESYPYYKWSDLRDWYINLINSIN